MEYDVVVIGSGPGGYVAAIRAAQLGLKVACIDRRKELGGTCLNVGCIPSKTLLHATMHGISFDKMMRKKEEVVKGFNIGIEGLFKKNKVTPIIGAAKILSPNKISVDGVKEITTKNIILATGSEPTPLASLPFDEKRIVSSTGALALTTIPKKLLVIGAGVIGVELGSVYKRLGSEVVFVELSDRILSTFDEGLSKAALEAFTKQGMKFFLSSKDLAPHMDADVILVSIGRKPYTANLGLENVGITPTPKGFIPIDGQFRTSVPNIYAIGDIVDGPMLAHKGSEEGVAAAEIIAGHNPVVNYMIIPNVVYTHPEIASVGLTEKGAKDLGLTINIGNFPFKANSRARCVDDDEGFVKVLADTTTDKILGVHIIGPQASELISSASIAMATKMTAEQLGNMCIAHPTLTEALKEAALAVHRKAIHK